MIGIVMAGGRASRFREPVEKGLLTVGGRSLLERSLDALHVDGIDEIAVAVTPHTPKTKEAAAGLGFRAVDTSGAGYHEDVMRLLNDHDSFLSLNVDAPFVRKEHVSDLMRRFNGGSLAGVIKESTAISTPDEDSVVVAEDGERLVWVGLNIVTPNPHTAIALFDDPLLAVNVNDEKDLARADETARELGI
ncbi:MAG: NTP transferase domain-containing protein [Methanobacteriota archaeon]|nr:MAG: NTP transferase domain-containing protein [Euryarchaeota archaeon]